MPQPNAADFPEYFGRYVSKVDAGSLAEAAEKYAGELNAFYTGLPEDKAMYAYAPGKWTLKEVLQHVIDAERIFSYRLMRIARHDHTPLPSFDENSYVANSGANQRSFQSLKDEFVAVRHASDLLIRSLTPEQLSLSGTASNLPVTANAIGFILFGHLQHHRMVIEEKYL